MTLHAAPHPSRYTGRADRKGLAACLDWCEAACVREALIPRDAYAVQLAIEEVCTNVVDHGYREARIGAFAIDLHRSHDDRGLDCLTITVVDDGCAFAPDNAPAPDLNATVNDRPIGGLGWLFVRSLMHSVQYQRDAASGTNRLTLVRRLGEGAHPQPGGGGGGGVA
jgi:anti-sigma regulatory factor (Ser/Thr protein kinase)